MVKHIILWKLKDEAKGEQLEKNASLLDEKFKALVGVVDGLITAEIGVNYNGGPADLVLYTEFANKEAEKGYQTHPAHLEIKKIVHTLVVERNCVDYEVE